MNLVLLLLFAALDLPSVKAIPDLGRRSESALALANDQVDVARQAYQAGKIDTMNSALTAIRDSVDIAEEALELSTRKARGSRYYKSAELKTRALARRLTTFADDVSIDDRKPVSDVLARVQAVHDRLLNAIMTNHK